MPGHGKEESRERAQRLIYNYEAVASPISTKPVRRISDLQRSAFWIYGITAMVMREPFGIIVRHSTEAGWGNWQVRLEVLRVLVILLLLSRLFLVSGLYFEQVYMQPDSADRYPKRSYPIDFLAGLKQFLVGAAATTTVAMHQRVAGEFAPFTMLVALFLLVDAGWLAVAKLRGFSAAGLIQKKAVWNAGTLLAAFIAWGVARAAGADAVFADQVALGVLAVACCWDVLQQVRIYESFDNA
jgi:hypothetical protein